MWANIIFVKETKHRKDKFDRNFDDYMNLFKNDFKNSLFIENMYFLIE